MHGKILKELRFRESVAPILELIAIKFKLRHYRISKSNCFYLKFITVFVPLSGKPFQMHHLAHQIITPPRLAADGHGFAFVGQFRVIMQLDPSTDWTKLQYRQYIMGKCLLYHGSFSSLAHSRATWSARGLPESGNHYFSVPGGLSNEYKEDGEVINGATSRFGYRNNPPVFGLGIEDRYLPSQRAGRIYHSLDTFGMRGTRRETGLRIIYNLYYEGRIIDTTLRGRQTILRRRWSISADDIIA
jgi:hypothetical protein